MAGMVVEALHLYLVPCLKEPLLSYYFDTFSLIFSFHHFSYWTVRDSISSTSFSPILVLNRDRRCIDLSGPTHYSWATWATQTQLPRTPKTYLLWSGLICTMILWRLKFRKTMRTMRRCHGRIGYLLNRRRHSLCQGRTPKKPKVLPQRGNLKLLGTIIDLS
jgi:hypothetical protein